MINNKLEEKKDEIVKLLEQGISFRKLQKIYNVSRKSLESFFFRNNLKSKNQLNRIKKKNIDTTLLPVPIKYSQPLIMKLRIHINNYSYDSYYVPEINKWVSSFNLKRTLKTYGIDYNDWINRWIDPIKDDIINEKIDTIIKNRYSTCYPNTKSYIKSQLLKDINWSCDWHIIVKQDLIDQYNLTRTSENKFNYDFSDVPEIIPNKYTKFKLNCLELDSFGNIIGEYITSFQYLIDEGKDHRLLGNKKISKLKSYNNDKFIEVSIKAHGPNRFGYDKLEYTGYSNSVILYCNKCKKYFSTNPKHHLEASVGCPFCNMSIGESNTSIWLENNKISYIFDKPLIKDDNIVYVNNGTIAYIDFQFNYNQNNYWIEYNGKQHYKYIKRFHSDLDSFKKQLERDENIRNYCKENNIILIEIPYTYNTYEKVEQLLNRVILNGEDINSIIDYSKLYKI